MWILVFQPPYSPFDRELCVVWLSKLPIELLVYRNWITLLEIHSPFCNHFWTHTFCKTNGFELGMVLYAKSKSKLKWFRPTDLILYPNSVWGHDPVWVNNPKRNDGGEFEFTSTFCVEALKEPTCTGQKKIQTYLK
jgi:hypothetical protein